MVLQETIPLENGDAVAAADVVRDLCRESLVVHQQEIQLPDVADQELLETVWQNVASLCTQLAGELEPRTFKTYLLVASVTNLRGSFVLDPDDRRTGCMRTLGIGS